MCTAYCFNYPRVINLRVSGLGQLAQNMFSNIITTIRVVVRVRGSSGRETNGTAERCSLQLLVLLWGLVLFLAVTSFYCWYEGCLKETEPRMKEQLFLCRSMFMLYEF